MLLKNRLNDLKKVFKAENILLGKEECYCYAFDSSNLKSKTKIPETVIFVETIEDVQKVLQYAYKNNIPVISRGAGTNMVGACRCTEGGIILNFSKMNKILSIDSSNMTATVQPGVVVGDLKKATEAFGMFFPPDPSNFKVSTIGGAIAQSSGGAKSLKYGTTKDYVLSLKVVTSDGKLMTLGAKTIKDAVGYHFAQLMVGSEGTLAVIVEATLKLIPKPQTSRTILIYFDDIKRATTFVDKIITSNVYPSAVDFIDNNTINTIEDFSHCGLNRTKQCMLLVELDGFLSAINEQIEIIKKLLGNFSSNDLKIATNEEESDRFWQARRASYAATARLAPDVLSEDIIVPRNKLYEMISECNSIAKKYDLKICLIGHVGDGNLHPQFAIDLSNDEEFKKYMDAKSQMYKFALELGGTISGEHGIGIEKKDYLEESVGNDTIEYMRMIKKIFDPKGILNPGKIF